MLYLDLPHEVVHDRNHGKFPPGSMYIDLDLNAAIRAYFRRLAGRETPRVNDRNSPRVVWLDATLDLPELVRQAAAHIWRVAGRRDTEGVP